MWPSSDTSQTTESGLCHIRSRPRPPAWRRLFEATSFTALTMSPARPGLIPAWSASRQTKDRRHRQRSGAERELDGRSGWLGQRRRARTGQLVDPGIPGAGAVSTVAVDERVAPACLVDDVLTERGGVVRTHQAEAAAPGEGHVEQGLVTLALDELLRAPLRPDRLADASHRTVPVLAHELRPGRDDPGGVDPDIGHVGEPNRARGRPELFSEQIDLPGADDHENGFPDLDGVPDERGGPLEELGLAGVEERLVPEGGVIELQRVGGRGCHHGASRR